MCKTPTGAKHPAKTAARDACVAHNEKEAAAIGSPERILEWRRRNPLPTRSRRSVKEIDAGIAAERDAWD